VDPTVKAALISVGGSLAVVLFVWWKECRADRKREAQATALAIATRAAEERQQANALAIAGVEKQMVAISVNVNGHLTALLEEIKGLRSRAEHAEGRREGIEAAVVEEAARVRVANPEAEVREPLPLNPPPKETP